jgi:hypothetical protein
MTWSDYTSKIRAIINEFGQRRLVIGEVPLKSRLVKNKGEIFTKAPHITFQDNAIFEFSEEISIVSNHVHVDTYKYQYQRVGGYYFRYEKEPTEDIIWKPPEHLHVLFKVPHFNSPVTTLEQVFRLIEVNFYQEEKRKEIIGVKLEVTI